MGGNFRGGNNHRPTYGWRPYPERTLHLIDIENLANAPLPARDMVSWVHDLYGKRVGFGPADQVVVASSHLSLLSAALGWPHARYLIRSGPNGADIELLDVVLHENVTGRFAHVVIGSGDGIFAAAAAALAARGIVVTVASRRRSLSARLRLAAHEVIFIDDPETPTPLAA